MKDKENNNVVASTVAENNTEVFATQKLQSTNIKEDVLNTLVVPDEMALVLKKVLKNLEEDRETALDDHEMIKDMVANGEGLEPSDAAKQQLSALLQVSLDASEIQLKVIDTLLRALGKGSTPDKAEQTNIFVGDRRGLIKEIEGIVEKQGDNKNEKP